MAPVPGLGPWLGAAYLSDAASRAGYGWLPPVLALATATCSAAILRAAARIYLGWGDRCAPFLTASEPDEPEEGEGEEARAPSRWRLLSAPWALIIVGAGAAFAPTLTGRARHLGTLFVDARGYADEVLHGTVPPAPHHLTGFAATAASWGYGAAAAAGALALAAAGLWWSRLPRLARVVLHGLRTPVHLLKAAHSGAVGDYALWLTGGAAVLLFVSAVSMR